MPKVETKYFGLLDYEEDAVLHFPAGLPGFESETRFLLIDHPRTKPLVHMQSMRDPGLCFLTLPAQTVEPQYQFTIGAEERAMLGLAEGYEPVLGGDILCLVMLTLLPDQAPTTNLLAPVVIHLANHKAVQVVQSDSRYSHQHAVRPEGSGPSCS